MKRFLITIICCVVIFSNSAQTIPQKTRNEFKSMFVGICKEMNQQTPIHLDETTTLVFMSFTDWTLTYHYKIDYSYTDFTENQINLILSNLKENGVKGWRREIHTWGKFSYSQYLSYLRRLGLKIRYDYIGYDNLPFGSFTITCRDLQ